MPEQEEKEGTHDIQQIHTMMVDAIPRADHVVGKARMFIDDFLLAIDTEGIYKAMGVNSEKTFLLYGPPGTGKTMAIHAINNEANTELFMKRVAHGDKVDTDDVKLIVFPYDIGKYGTSFINMGSKRVQTFFDIAGAYAKYGKKVLVVLDEADSIVASRQGNVQTHAEDRKVLETIMKNIQISHDTPNMYVALMTNLPEICDEAVLRAGRIDRKYEFTLPNMEERVLGYEHAISMTNQRAKYAVIRGYNAQTLAEISHGFSYADINQSTEMAVKQRAKEVSLDKTKGIIPAAYIKQSRLEEAVKKHAQEFKKGTQKVIGF